MILKVWFTVDPTADPQFTEAEPLGLRPHNLHFFTKPQIVLSGPSSLKAADPARRGRRTPACRRRWCAGFVHACGALAGVAHP